MASTTSQVTHHRDRGNEARCSNEQTLNKLHISFFFNIYAEWFALLKVLCPPIREQLQEKKPRFRLVHVVEANHFTRRRPLIWVFFTFGPTNMEKVTQNTVFKNTFFFEAQVKEQFLLLQKPSHGTTGSKLNHVFCIDSH